MMDMKVDNGPGGLTRVGVEYPSNSHSHKSYEQKPEEKKVVKKVIKGKVIRTKKPFGKRLFETFIGDNISGVAGYVVHDVLIPAAKSMIYDMVKGSFEMALFGERQGSRTTRDGGRSRVNYGGFSSIKDTDRFDRVGRRDRDPISRARHNFDDIALETRAEAEEVLSCLVDLCIDYDQATVADLYDLVGITAEFTDDKYGWRDLRKAYVVRGRDGFKLDLPRTIQLT